MACLFREGERGLSSSFDGSLLPGVVVIENQTAGLKAHDTLVCPALAPPHAAHQRMVPSGKNKEAEVCDQIKPELPRLDAVRSIPCNRRGALESA